MSSGLRWTWADLQSPTQNFSPRGRQTFFLITFCCHGNDTITPEKSTGAVDCYPLVLPELLHLSLYLRSFQSVLMDLLTIGSWFQCTVSRPTRLPIKRFSVVVTDVNWSSFRLDRFDDDDQTLILTNQPATRLQYRLFDSFLSSVNQNILCST